MELESLRKAAVEEFIEESLKSIFDLDTLLESIAWRQYKDENDQIVIDLDNIIINENTYSGKGNSWKLDIMNNVKWAIEALAPEDLELAFGSSVKVVVTREGIELEQF